MKRIVVFIAALLVLQCSYAQKANTAKKRIIQVFEISCDIKETFGDIVIEKEDTITRTYYDKQGRIVYEVLQYNNPTLSGNEMGMEYGDIESAMTHDMNYSKTQATIMHGVTGTTTISWSLFTPLHHKAYLPK